MFSSNARRPMAGDKADTTAIVPGRACGECSLCCKLIRVDAFAKAPGTWCAHCAPGCGGVTKFCTRAPRGVALFFLRGRYCHSSARRGGRHCAQHALPAEPDAGGAARMVVQLL